MTAGLVLATLAAPADLLISSDGRHAAVRLQDGRLAFLRNRTGAFLRDMWGDALATEGDARFAELPGMACSRDACVASIDRGGRHWRLLATVSRDFIDRSRFEPACAAADIVIADRRMPAWCRPRWQIFDRSSLAETGALAVWLGAPRIEAANTRIGDHPWRPQPLKGQRHQPRRSD